MGLTAEIRKGADGREREDKGEGARKDGNMFLQSYQYLVAERGDERKTHH